MHFKWSWARRNKCIRHLEEETDCFCSCGWYFLCRPQCEEIITKNYLLSHPIASSASPSLIECVSERLRLRDAADMFVTERKGWRRRGGDRCCINLSAFITATCSHVAAPLPKNIKRFSKLKGQFTQLLKHSFIPFAKIVETSASLVFWLLCRWKEVHV